MSDILVSLICVAIIIIVFFYPYHVIAVFDSIKDPVIFALSGRNVYSYYQVSEDGKQYELRSIDDQYDDPYAAYLYRKAEVLPDVVNATPCSELDMEKNLLCKQPVVDSYYNRLMSRIKFINTLTSRTAAQFKQSQSTYEKNKKAGIANEPHTIYNVKSNLRDQLSRI